MNVFDTHKQIVDDYAQYIQSFINISDPDIAQKVEESLSKGRLWPDPLLQFNPAYEMAGTIEEVVGAGLLHDDAKHIFSGYSLYCHQREAIELGVGGSDFVVTSGTGSGKSLTYIGTIFNHLLAHQGTEGVIAVIVYPMNALINSQTIEFNTYKDNYEKNTGSVFPITFNQYTGQEKEDRRNEMREVPPQVLLTNYMMLELLLTRTQERSIRDAIFENLRYLVFDELHTYRGRQGADVSMLIRRILAQCKQPVVGIGTSATMVSVGSTESQRQEVADVASTIFGRPFMPDQVVDETLVHSLHGADKQITKSALHEAIIANIDIQAGEDELRRYPVAAWLENRIALEDDNGRLVRRTPMKFGDVVSALADESGAPEDDCRSAIESTLQWVSTVNQRINEAGSRYSILPFKLHQFISQTGSVYTTLDQDGDRFITLEPGIYKQDDGDKPIYANVFSRATGYPFICVSLMGDRLLPREFRTAGEIEDDVTDGYLIISEDIWDPEQDMDYLPPTWYRVSASGEKKPVSGRRDHFPRKLYFDEHGNCSETEPSESMKYWGWYMKAPLLFDPTGGIPYEFPQNEGSKLTRLGSEGRSTSTTTVAFSVLRALRRGGLDTQDQKLLSFTDNRQDAALQAGHFNDFVSVVRLRAAIWKALDAAADGTLDYTTLGEAMFNALSLPFGDYSSSNTDIARIRKRYDEAFQELLLFRALGDLRRSWRVVLPNLEQCALLDIDYLYLDEVVGDDAFWEDLEAVNSLSHSARREFLVAILDHFRAEYAIHSENYLAPDRLKKYQKQFVEDLKAPWTLDSDEKLKPPCVLSLMPLHRSVHLPNKSMGSASALGKYIKFTVKQSGVSPDTVKGDNYRDFVLRLMRKLGDADYLVEETARNKDNEEIPVFRLRISKILWKPGDGETVKTDPIRRRAYKDINPSPNAFFRNIYQQDYTDTKQLSAADHTGQLSVELRQEREDRFRAEWYIGESGEVPDESRIRSESLSALFCSPTMELGVDIGGLSVVHMRNAPPNAANYVQRSGRAGRSGQGALVFTYCSSFSPHDRHYFQNQADLVAGAVHPPQIDLCNQELLLTHLHAMAIGEVGLPGLESQGGNKPSLMRLVAEDDPAMPLSPGVVDGLTIGQARFAAIKATFQRAIGDFAESLKNKSGVWYTDDWVDQNLDSIVKNLDKALMRWRNMLQSAKALLDRSTQPIKSGLLMVQSDEYKRYKRLQDQANRQLNLLRNEQAGHVELSEFYPYRYLASEGFLPGYNFTRLPLRVFLPTGSTSGEYISRPRDIALREFGPHNIIYHGGRKFRISQLIAQEAESSLIEAKISKRSGYFLMGEQRELEICPFSGLDLSDNVNKEHLHDLIEMAESRGEERARITCEEEERISLGYQIDSFFHVDGGDFSIIRQATATSGGNHLLNLRFIPAARLVSVNRGWRAERTEGFTIGLTSGNWHKSMPAQEANAEEDHRLVRLWTSNLADALYIEPIAALGLNADGVVTLQYALKRAIESVFRVEPREIGVSVMGDPDAPNILLYEAAEGSLGVLSQFADNIDTFRNVIEVAEQVCRYDNQEYKAPASYDDLMSYYNQRDHQRLDRFLIRDALSKLKLADIELQTSSDFKDYEDQYQHMLRNLDPNSSTEREFIKYLYQNGLRLPDDAQRNIPDIYCKPDFYYEPRIWIFCDGSPHDDADVRTRDEAQRQLIIARGDEVWSWHYREDLGSKIEQRPDIFKRVR